MTNYLKWLKQQLLSSETERLIEKLKEDAAKRSPEERAVNVERFRKAIDRIDEKLKTAREERPNG